jgi:Fe2+ or Zn2+ uptake regulation protein
MTTCIEQATIPNIPLPEGFTAKEKILVIQGLCKNCNA